MSEQPPEHPGEDGLHPPKATGTPLRTEEVESTSGGLFVSTIWHCEIHPDQLQNHRLPDGKICPGR